LIHVAGNSNMISSNYFDHQVPGSSVNPSGANPTIVLVTGGGQNNMIATNMTTSQVSVKTVVLDVSTAGTVIMDSGTSGQIQSYASSYSLRPTP